MARHRRPETYLPMTIAGGIIAAAGRFPDKPALGLGDQQLTYRQLVERIYRVANGAREDLELAGAHAAILAPNCLEYIELICGLAEVGATAVTLNPRLTLPEIEFICNDSDAKVLFTHPSLEETARAVTADSLERVILLDDRYQQWLGRASTDRPSGTPEEWQPFAMHYTAGTTGKPKGVLVPHRSRALTFFGMAVEYGCYGPEDRALGIAPMFHGAGLAFSLAPVFFGGYCEIISRFDPEYCLRRLVEGGHTNTFMVPTHFNAIFQLEPKVLQRHRDFSSLRTIVSNAAPLAQTTKERIVEYFGDGVLHETYGSTEAGIVSNLRPPDQLHKKQCVGLPFPYTRVRLLDEDGRDLANGEVGELYSHSPYLFNGYWKRPRDTRKALRNGWLSVGDLARRDDEGYLYLVDRKKDVVISGGVNVYPREVEECLHTYPAVADVAVVGRPDDYWGEAVVAFVVLQPGHHASAEELIAHCEMSLARYKLPKSVHFIDALPRNAAGKILKRELREGRGQQA